MSKRAFTLIELLVTLAIFSIIIIFVYSTYTGILFDFKNITKQAATQSQTVPALNVLRLDLEHAGYGLDPSISSNKPIEWDNSTKSLIIRSTINTTNNATIGWELVSCNNAGNFPTKLASYDNTTYDNTTHMVWLDTKQDNKFIANGTAGACPPGINTSDGNAILLGFPYDNSPANGCTSQFCNKIIYRLSSTQDIPNCNPNTRKLLRVVDNGTGDPILNCVADFKAQIIIDNSTGKPTPNVAKVYILLQEGQKNRKYNFTTSSLTEDGITFNLPSNYQHYHWKIIKLSVKPMSDYRSLP